MKDRCLTAAILLLAALIVVPAVAQQKDGKSASATPAAQTDKLKPQTVCPVMGGKIASTHVALDVSTRSKLIPRRRSPN